GSRVMEDCTEREGIVHIQAGDNRERFARAAIMYGWLTASDRQFIYGKNPPYRVYSVDHGHFYPGGPDWTMATLSAAPWALIDPEIVAACNFSHEQLKAACQRLHKVNVQHIAAAVASVPVTWGITSDE